MAGEEHLRRASAVTSVKTIASPPTPNPTAPASARPTRCSTTGWRNRPRRAVSQPRGRRRRSRSRPPRGTRGRRGDPKDGDVEDRQSRTSQKPVQESRPTKMSAPTPAPRRPRDENDAQHRAAESGGLHQEERPDQRRTEERTDRREASCRPDHGNRLRRHRVLLEQVNGEDAEPAADRDQRRLQARARPHAEAEGRQ